MVFNRHRSARRICGGNLTFRSNCAPQVYQTRLRSKIDLIGCLRGSYGIMLSPSEFYLNSFPCRCGSKESWNLPIYCIGVSSTFWLCVVSKLLPAKKKRQKPMYSCVKFISDVKLNVDKSSYKHVRFWSNLRGSPGQLFLAVLSKWAYIIELTESFGCWLYILWLARIDASNRKVQFTKSDGYVLVLGLQIFENFLARSRFGGVRGTQQIVAKSSLLRKARL